MARKIKVFALVARPARKPTDKIGSIVTTHRHTVAHNLTRILKVTHFAKMRAVL